MMLSSDRMESKGSCFSLFTNDTRRVLIQKYFMNSYPQMRIDYSSLEASSNELCELVVEKVKTENKENISFQSGKSPQGKIQQYSRNAKERSELKALPNAPFELTVDEQQLTGKCRYINPSRYEITFSMKFIPKPIIPAAPPGTEGIINNPPPIENQTGTSLTTTVQLNKGERVELGSITRNLKDQGQKISLVPKMKIEKGNEDSEEKIYLMIK